MKDIGASFDKSKTGQHVFRVTVKNETTGEVMYDEAAKGGVLVSIEDLRMESFGSIMGTQQIFQWGNPVGWFYAYDQLKQHLTRPEYLEKIKEAMKASGFAPGVIGAVANVHDSVKARHAKPRPETLRDEITLLPFGKGSDISSEGMELIAGEDITLACGHGIQADLFKNDGRYVCPEIHSVAPGSGKLDLFLRELVAKLDAPLVFANVINARLKVHLEKAGFLCLE